MKNFKHHISFFLAICLILSTALSFANASEFDVQNNVLGGIEDESGYLIPDEPSTNNSSRAVHLPELPGNPTAYEIFSIKATKVTNLLTSNAGGKSFNLSQLPTSARTIICQGTLYHSLADVTVNASMSGGICHFDANRQEYVSDIKKTAEHGITFTRSDTISTKLSDGVFYYSYIKNEYPTGYVWGNLTIYYA